MLSFSVNAGLDNSEKIKRVADLIKQINEYTEEYVADAFFNIAHGNIEKVRLAEYANIKNKERKRELYEKENLLTEDEVAAGFEGVTDIIDPTDYEGIVIDDAETEYFVETFLDLRQFLFFVEGVDIWRMITLVRKGDPAISNKIRAVADKYGMTSFLTEFCSNLGYIYAVQKILH